MGSAKLLQYPNLFCTHQLIYPVFSRREKRIDDYIPDGPIGSMSPQNNHNMEIYPVTIQEDVNRTDDIPIALHPSLVDWATTDFSRYHFGNILTQRFNHKLYSIYIFNCTIHKLAFLKLAVERPTVGLLFMLSGVIHTQETLFPGTYSMHYLPKGEHKFKLKPGDYEIFGIDLSPALLEDLSGRNAQVKALLSDLASAREEPRRLEPLLIPYRLRAIIEEIRQSDETDGDLLMELTTMIANLLNFYRKGMSQKEYLRALPDNIYKEILISIREEISHDPNKLKHTVHYFTARHSLSDSTIKRAFKTYFGESLGAYVTKECMKKAAWLVTDPRLSLDDIAEELGYSEKSGFIRAYRRIHGKAPKQKD